MTFKQWLRTQTKRNDPVGDFAKDAMRDKETPRGKNNLYRRWRLHLNNLNACDHAMRAFDRAWQEWTIKYNVL